MLTDNRIMSRGLLLFILLTGLPVCVPICRWRWEWSFRNPTPPASRPPLSPSCLLSQSDSVLLSNSGPEAVALFRVNGTAIHTCDTSQLIGQPLTLPPNSSMPLNLSLSNQESAVHMVSQSKRGDCLRLSFSLTNQTRESCDAPTECVRSGPCFRRLSLPLRPPAPCQLSPGDWIVAENPSDTIRNISHLHNASCYSNYSIKLEPNQSALLPPSHIPQTGSLLLSDSISCEFITVPILPNPCTDSLCPLMPLPDTYSHLTPLAVSLLSLLLLLAGVSTLLALCLRRKQRIASEETPPPQGELSGRYEMRREGNLVREPEVKARKKAVPLTTSPAPPEEAEPVRRSIILEKRSSQFSELLSKFS